MSVIMADLAKDGVKIINYNHNGNLFNLQELERMWDNLN